MGGFAWVTLATNDSYSLGALVLANSLKQAGTAHQLVVLVTPGVTPSMRGKLSQVFDVVQEVNILDSQDKTNLKLLKRPELGITFTKLHCWRLTQYDKCVFLDADTLVLQNCDELFEREELSAAPDVGWPDCFNSGVFVYKPSNSTYENLIEFALDKGSFDGGDQGLLNLYFSDWAHKDISKHLPFIYNVCSTAFYSYLPAFKQYGKNAKIIHFIGNSKPWLLYFDSESKKVKPPSELYHITAILQLWWDIFCSKVHENLSREMAGLAGALAQMTLGVPRTAEQEALEDHYRKQCWELGNIDYLGKDSFDNIWQKICETLATGPAAGQEKTVETVKQEATVEKVEEKRAEEKPVEPIKQEPTVEKVEEKSAEALKEALPPQEPVPVQQQEPVPQTIQTEDILTCQLKTEEPKEQVAPAEPLKECEQPKTEKSPEVKQDDKTKTPSPPKETSDPPKHEEVKTAAPQVATTTPSDVAATIKDIKNEPSENSQKSPLEIAPKPSETGLPPANIETSKEAETPAQKIETEHVAEISQKTESQPTTDPAPSAPVAEAALPVEPQAPLVIPQKEQVPTTPSVQAEPPKFPKPAPVESTKPLESAAPETKIQEPVKVLETVSNQQSAAKESPPQTPAESPTSPESPKPQIPVPQATNEPPTTKETSPQSTKEPLKTSDTPKPSETPSPPTSSETKVQPVQSFKETSLLNEPKVSESKPATPVTESSTPTEKSQSSEPRQPANPTPPPRKAASGNKKPTKKK